MSHTDYFNEVSNKHSIPDLTSREFALKLDELDHLHYLRQNFHIPKMSTLPGADQSLINPNEDSIYLCGNSLGLLPKATKGYIDEQLRKWSDMGVFGHTCGPIPWESGDECVVKGVQQLVGGKDGEVALMNGLSVNLHILLTSFYLPTKQKHKVVLESQAFPSDHYAVESQIRLKGFDPRESMVCLKPREGEYCLRTEDIIEFIEKEADSIALVIFGGVQYYTGELFDIPRITKAARAKGCVIGWDLAHTFANVPLKLHEWDVDFACWCSYKFK